MFLQTGKSAFVKTMATALCGLFAGVASATVPAVVASNHQAIVTTGLPVGSFRVAANARGDVFYATPNSVATDYADMKLMELPAGATTPITLLYNLNGPRAVDIDPWGNVYVNDTSAGRVIMVPFVGGSYAQNIDAFTVAGNSKATPVVNAVTCATLPNATTAAPTSDCSLPTLGVLTGYYSQTLDTAIDGAGNYYFLDVSDNVSAGKYSRIVELTHGGVVSVVVDGLTTAYNAQLASDAAGNLYYANNTSLYSIPAGSGTATVMNASALLKPGGVTVDAAGNLIVSDSGNSRIVVEPFENGAVNFANQYLLAPYYTPVSVGIDGFGTMYYSTSNGGTGMVQALNTSVYNYPALAVNATSASALVYFSFNAQTKVGGFSVRGNGATVAYTGNTCPSSVATAVTYTAGQSCSYNPSIKPTRVGAVSAYVGLNDGAGNIVAQFTLTTTGLGSAENIDPGTVTAIGAGYTTPQGVAVDRAGNVFVADFGASTVWELVGGSGTPVAVGTGLNKPTGVSVDLAGNLFIADTGNQRVVEVPLVGTGVSTAAQVVVASNLLAPIVVANGPLGSLYVASSGVLSRYEVRGTLPPALAYTATSVKIALPSSLAVDNTGNVFVGDASAGVVAEFTAAQTLYTSDPQVNVVTGLTTPTGLATDTAGNLFVVDAGTAQVLRVPNTNGTLDSTAKFSVGTFTTPYGIAVDSAGNLIVSDTTTGATTVNRVTRTTAALNFPYQNLNTTSAPLTSQVVSSGTSALTLGTPVYTATGDTARFSLTGSTCTAAQTLAVAGTCNLTATFTPTTKAASQEVLAINATPTVATAPFSLTLNGLGTLQVGTTLVIQKPAGSISYGSAVTITAVLTPASFNVANPTGMVVFTINGQVQKPVAISTTGGVTTATITISSLSGGDNSVAATYSGDINYSPSSAATVLVTVGTASTTTTLSIAVPFANPLSQTVNGSVTLTATVNASVAGSLSGNVNFISGGTVLGSAAVGLVSGTTYQAVLKTTSIPAGNYNIYAEYVGNTNYTKSDSAAQQLVISNAAILLTSNTYSVTSSAGNAGVATLSLSSVGGLGSPPNAAPVSLQCSGLPANAICRFVPGYLTTLTASAAPTAVSLQFVVDYTDGTPLPPIAALRSRTEVVLAFLVGMPALVMMRRKKRLAASMTLVAALLVFPLTLAISGCSSGTTPTAVTPAGTYPIVVKALVNNSTYPNVSSSITINLTVK